MSQFHDLAAHITALVEGNPDLAAYMGEEWLFTELPEQFPCIYLDGFQCLDDKQDSWRVNINFVTEDMSVDALPVARTVLNTIQRSPVILTNGMVNQPEADNARNRFRIPSIIYMSRL
jgi:hypothetical protein